MTEGVCPMRHPDGAVKRASVGALCFGCARQVHRRLDALPKIAAWLRASSVRWGSTVGEKVAGTRDAPLPMNAEMVDVAEAIRVRLVWWASLVADERSVSDPSETCLSDLAGRVVPARPGVTLLARFLRRHAQWLLERHGQAFAAELDKLVSDAQALAPWNAGRHRLDVPCPNLWCGVKALVRFDGSDAVECSERLGGCGHRWGEDDDEKGYHWLMRVLAAEQDAASANEEAG